MFPAGVETVTLTAGAAGYRTLDGDPYQGTIRLTPSVPRVVSAEHGVIALGQINITLGASGEFSEDVLANDADGFSPSGWAYRVDEEFTNAPGRAWNISLPASAGTVALPTLVEVGESGGVEAGAEAVGTAAAAVAAHNADATDVHGIPDTALLETAAGAQAKADVAQSAATAAAATDATDKVTTHSGASDPHGDRAWASTRFLLASSWRRRDLPDLLIADALSTETLVTPTSAANASPQLATAVQVVPNTGPYQYCGAGDFQFGTVSPDTNYYLPTSKTPHLYATPQSTWSAEWCTNAPRLEVRFKYISAATMYRLVIDGRPITQLMQALPTNITYTAGSGYRMLLDLGTTKARRWRLDLSTFPFGGVYIEPAYDVWRPATRGGRLAVLGDSISDGSAGNAGGGNGTWFKRFARMIGCNDDWDQAKGSTGYIAAGTSQTFVDRAQSDVVAYSPDRVFVFGGYNDTAATQSQLQTAAASVFSTLKTGLPNAQIVVIGCWSPTAAPATGLQNIDTWLRASAQTAGLPFVSPQSGAVYSAAGALLQTDGAWITSGNVASYVYATDNVHLTDAGHAAIARRVYDAYMALLA